MTNYRIASFFAGVGGIDIAFEQSGFKVVYANEFDSYAADTYDANSDIKVDRRDIHDVNPSEIPAFDVMVGGFPCQAFSIAGYREGFNDKKGRGELFFELVRIAQFHLPKVIFLENVKNLKSHDKGRTYKIIKTELESMGYLVTEKIINSFTHGNSIQNRERIYIVAFKDPDIFKKFEFPENIENNRIMSEYLDNEIPNKYIYDDRYKMYDQIKEEVNETDIFYQWRRQYVRKNKNGMCPTLTANMGTGGHNVPLIFHNNNIRKLTPRECFRIQEFPDSFHLPKHLSDAQLYKQAGNTVVVSVVKRISDNLMRSLTA